MIKFLFRDMAGYHIFYYSDDHRHGQSRRDQSAEGFVPYR